jgi:hypothetical protein
VFQTASDGFRKLDVFVLSLRDLRGPYGLIKFIVRSANGGFNRRYGLY